MGFINTLKCFNAIYGDNIHVLTLISLIVASSSMAKFPLLSTCILYPNILVVGKGIPTFFFGCSIGMSSLLEGKSDVAYVKLVYGLSNLNPLSSLGDAKCSSCEWDPSYSTL